MNVAINQPRLDLGDRPVGHAQLTNMSLALRTLMDCHHAGESSPRMGLFYGYSGYGKSVAAAFAAARLAAAYVEAKSVWTQRSILEAIATELGIVKLERTTAKIFDQIVDLLNNEPRPIIVDEMDYLVKKSFVEIIRDIHDATRVGIMMIGEEALPTKLKEWERFHNRILIATPAMPASFEDACALRDHYCRRVDVADDLVMHIRDACKGVTRRIYVNLERVQRLAAEEGEEAVDLNWWGNRPVTTGDVPVRRLEAV